MRKLLAMLLFFLVALSQPLWSASYITSEEAEELKEIVAELSDLNKEQEQIIENSQTRNEQLEKLSSEQEKQLEELKNLSENKQQIIDEQQTIIDELKSLSKEQRKSSIKTWISIVLVAVASFFSGYLVGRF